MGLHQTKKILHIKGNYKQMKRQNQEGRRVVVGGIGKGG